MLHDNDAVDEREKSVVFRIIAIMLIAILMAMWVRTFLATEQNVASTNFSVLARNFTEAINLARVDWLRMGKPKKVTMAYLDSNNSQSVDIYMSASGWPTIESVDDKGCELLWVKLLAVPAETIKHKLLSSYQVDEKGLGYCLYAYNKTQKLRYFVDNGVVLLNID